MYARTKLIEEMDLHFENIEQDTNEKPYLSFFGKPRILIPFQATEYLGSPKLVGFYPNLQNKILDIRGFSEKHSTYHVNNPNLYPLKRVPDNIDYSEVILPPGLVKMIVSHWSPTKNQNFRLEWSKIHFKANGWSVFNDHKRVRLTPSR